VIHPKYSLPGPGSTKIRVLVNSAIGYTTLAGLRFQDNATVNIRDDGCLQLDRLGVRAVDAHGNSFRSEIVTRPDGTTETLMVKVKGR
jgi:hypothetical protein